MAAIKAYAVQADARIKTKNQSENGSVKNVLLKDPY